MTRHPPARKVQPQPLDALERHADIEDKSYRRIVELRPRAKRFIFDTEASRHLGHFIRECGDLIIHNRQFALNPFEVTYLEIDLNATIDAIGRGGSEKIFVNSPIVDSTIGYVLHKQWVYPIITGESSNAVRPTVNGKGLRSGTWPSIFYYERNTPAGVGPIFANPIREHDRDDEWARAALLLGTTLHDVPDEATRLDIVRSTRVHLNDDRWSAASEETREILLYGAMGEMRYVWAALLLLNQKHGGVSFRDVPWQAAIYKGKRKVFGAHSVVKVHLAPKQSMRQMMRPALHVPLPAHPVKGHFAHWHLKDGCEHQWPAMPEVHDDEIPRWHCARCNGLRVWKKDYVTGDATVGFTTKSYQVTK